MSLPKRYWQLQLIPQIDSLQLPLRCSSYACASKLWANVDCHSEWSPIITDSKVCLMARHLGAIQRVLEHINGRSFPAILP
jgi:hypothetical protein